MTITTNDAFAERERALENEFCYKVDQKLLEKLRRTVDLEETKHALASASHIHDETLLKELAELGVKPESLAAVNVIPLVIIAWANHQLPPQERLAVLALAAEEGVSDGSPAYGLLEHWLREEPGSQLRQVWKHFVQEILASLSPVARTALQREVMSRARAVAKTAHGVFEFGRLSPGETQVLVDLESAFTTA